MTRKEIIKEVIRLSPDFSEALENTSDAELSDILKIAQREMLIVDKIVLIKNKLGIKEKK